MKTKEAQEFLEYIQKRIELDKTLWPEGFEIRIGKHSLKYRADILAGMLVSEGYDAQDGFDGALVVCCWKDAK